MNDSILYKLIQETRQKSGVLLSESEEFIANCINNYNLNITGLMWFPVNENPQSHFLTLKSIASNFNLSNLSMGIDDYEIAIQCGSTHIRIGREIFGERLKEISICDSLVIFLQPAILVIFQLLYIPLYLQNLFCNVQKNCTTLPVSIGSVL